jgi:hypothetical protein
MNTLYPVDPEGQANASPIVVFVELATMSPVHAIDVAGAINVSLDPENMWSGPKEPLVCVAAIDIVAIPATKVAAATATLVMRKAFLFMFLIPIRRVFS